MQAALTLHRTRDLFVKQRTQLVNMIRGLLVEFGIEIRRGIEQALMLAKRIAAHEVSEIPPLATKMIADLAGQVLDLQARLCEIDRELLAWLRTNDVAKRLATIPGIAMVCATALAASVTDPHQFRSGRQGQPSCAPQQQAEHETAPDHHAKTYNQPLQCGSHPHRTLSFQPSQVLDRPPLAQAFLLSASRADRNQKKATALQHCNWPEA
jgi:hypothetical protein